MKNNNLYIDFFESKLDEAFYHASKKKMGMVRSTMKDSVEQLLDLIWETERNGKSKKNDFVESLSKTGHILTFQVDRHLYTNNLVGICECKAYLDRCFMERASSDFGRIKSSIITKPKAFILSLENCISDRAFHYYMDEDNIDAVFYLMDDKRNPKKPIWKKEYRKKINEDSLNQFVSYIQTI